MTGASPFVPFAVIERGGIAESHHHGVAVLADASGRIVARWGDPDVVTFPRSALKPFQAIDLLESGAFDAFGLTQAHLALACASHKGERVHAEHVTAWLAHLDCDETCLVCGPALPGDADMQRAWLGEGRHGSPVFYNCSGKHCGFLTNARHLGLPVAGYDSPDHPLQQRYRAVLSRYLEGSADALPWSRDDCMLPAPALSMRAMATAVARLSAQANGDAGAPAARIVAAMRAHPKLLAGTGALPEILVGAGCGRMTAKTGAEGYLAVFLPDEGLGLTIKAADGGARGRDFALAVTLAQVGLVTAAEHDALMEALAPPHADSRGHAVARLRPVLPAAGTA